MTNSFCTLFDSNYLSRGLAMYESLKKHLKDFHLYIFPFDDKCFEVLKKINLDNITLISLKEFENEELLKIKSTRTKTEYCWTCTPSIIDYCISNFDLSICTYLDADLYFFSSPEILLNEMGNNSIIISPHRYTDKYDQTKASGKYCVQFVSFRNDKNGLTALEWWRQSCIDWCYARVEDNKFGDQKYLDDWTSKFEGVHELKHLGGGVAPWNVQQYNTFYKKNILFGKVRSTDEIFIIVFYHFHGLKYFQNDIISLGSYELRKNINKNIYDKYIDHLENIRIKIRKFDSTFCPHGKLETTVEKPVSLKLILKLYLIDVFSKIKSLIKSILFINIINMIRSNNYKYKKY
jgi:hypothetical protein